ncbi:uncharacterized protein LOC143445535 [Clavelina lepadiformis]|uniref:WW domain-containing protein n=1 Tax=Clavelina lepadiformis TaxID=159417 RepID=A0ABP0FBB3_CLALP
MTAMSRRRPVLQITPDKETSGFSNSKSDSGLASFGSCQENLDEQNVKSNKFASEDNLSTKQLHNNVDTKVADFLKEIDTLNNAAPEDQHPKAKLAKSKTDVEKPVSKGAWGDWEQCIDESTQHPYFWNTVTNEVTWTLPSAMSSKCKTSNKESNSSNPDERNHNLSANETLTTNTASYKIEDHDAKQAKIEACDSIDKNIKLSMHETVPMADDTNQRDQLDGEMQKTEVITCIVGNEGQLSIDNESSKCAIEKEAAMLFKKLSGFDIQKSNMPPLCNLAIETEVRFSDWKAGALSDQYFKTKLEAAVAKVKQYGENILPDGWTCQWNSQYNRYYYINGVGQTQWNFPTRKHDDVLASSTPDSDVSEKHATNAKNNHTERIQASMPVKSQHLEDKKECSTSDCNAVETDKGCTPDGEILRTSQHEGEISKAKTFDSESQSPAPTSQDYSGHGVKYSNYNLQNYYWNMTGHYGLDYTAQYGHSTGITCYDDTHQQASVAELPPPPPGEDLAPLPPSTDPPPLPPPPGEGEEFIPPPPPPAEEEAPMENTDDGTEMDISDEDDDEQQETNVVGKKTGTSTLIELSQGPVEYIPTAASKVKTNITAQMKLSDGGKSAMPSGKVKRLNKKTKRDKLLTKKTPKQMFGMVAKWQKAKQEIEEEEKRLIMESEAELDRQQDVKQRIDKWKMDQLQSGKAASNANFHPISEDWKKKVRKTNKT